MKLFSNVYLLPLALPGNKSGFIQGYPFITSSILWKGLPYVAVLLVHKSLSTPSIVVFLTSAAAGIALSTSANIVIGHSYPTGTQTVEVH